MESAAISLASLPVDRNNNKWRACGGVSQERRHRITGSGDRGTAGEQRRRCRSPKRFIMPLQFRVPLPLCRLTREICVQHVRESKPIWLQPTGGSPECAYLIEFICFSFNFERKKLICWLLLISFTVTVGSLSFLSDFLHCLHSPREKDTKKVLSGKCFQPNNLEFLVASQPHRRPVMGKQDKQYKSAQREMNDYEKHSKRMKLKEIS
ncbi:hypothetical protein LXL04_028643 [Taraxacum kok-saghyz]